MNAAKLDVSTLLDDEVMWTLLGTLYLRAYESRSPHSIVGDHHAAEVLERIEYDERKLSKKLNPSANQYLVALRVHQLDVWCRDFLAKHPDATVLQLGCGLDSRRLRLSPPAETRWYDVDLPDVIALRRRLFDEADNYQMIAASVTSPEWLARIPAARPTLVIAEGLLEYLEPGDVRDLLQRLTERFTTGELIFDGIAPWVTRLAKVFRWGLRDGRELERWNPKLRCLEQPAFTTNYALIPSRGYRCLYRVGHAIPAWRNIFREYRFAF